MFDYESHLKVYKMNSFVLNCLRNLNMQKVNDKQSFATYRYHV